MRRTGALVASIQRDIHVLVVSLHRASVMTITYCTEEVTADYV